MTYRMSIEQLARVYRVATNRALPGDADRVTIEDALLVDIGATFADTVESNRHLQLYEEGRTR